MSFSAPNYGVSYDSLIQTTTDDSVMLAEKYAENFIKSQISDPNYDYEISAAQLWAIRQDDTFHLLNVHPDVYDLLSQNFILNSYKGILIHTSGWAAPLNDNGELDGKPSEHDLRRRVALAACVTSTSVGSALAFSDQKDLVIDPGSATGSLAEALLSFWELNSVSGIVSSSIENISL
jgi:hypothetical protein